MEAPRENYHSRYHDIIINTLKLFCALNTHRQFHCEGTSRGSHCEISALGAARSITAHFGARAAIKLKTFREAFYFSVLQK